MPSKDILVPNIGDFKDVEVIEVLVKTGQKIKKNDSLITIESDKSSVEVPSTSDGIIEKIKIKIGDKVSEGDLILTVNVESKIDVKEKSLEVTREIDEGLETIEVNIPAIVTCDLRLNEPRYASLPNIMKAKKKPLEQLNASDLGVDTKARIEQIKVEEPPKRKAGIKVASVSELVQKLKNEAKVI